ncbi:MAG: Cof-type HAD-IIB family hydrolase [Bacteroidales bacterium]|nr:Cof-type HAD-IIB family hydrolase [Bacteroidales bacterium]
MKGQKNIKLVATDLDGTLLNDDHKISTENLDMLKQLREKEIIRVVATGRSYYSFIKVIPTDFPIDYLAFSTGAGIMEWPSKQLIYSRYLKAEKVEAIARMLSMEKVDFMIHHAIPDNHYFDYCRFGYPNPDFDRRCNYYEDFSQAKSRETLRFFNATQILAIFPLEKLQLFDSLAETMKGVKVIKTTSPLDKQSLWMEIFPPEVSKGKAIEWLCDQEKINVEETLGIGNDFNDIDLLRSTQYSYVVENAALPLRQEFKATVSNNDHGFAEVIANHI